MPRLFGMHRASATRFVIHYVLFTVILYKEKQKMIKRRKQMINNNNYEIAVGPFSMRKTKEKKKYLIFSFGFKHVWFFQMLGVSP